MNLQKAAGHPRPQGSKIVYNSGLRYSDNKIDVHVGTRFEATRPGIEGFIHFALDLSLRGARESGAAIYN